jgi:stress response protein YsnF
MSETLNVTIHNVQTGEITIQPMTAEEIAVVENDRLQTEAMLAEKTQKAIDKAALLERLGITEDEAALLLGGN